MTSKHSFIAIAIGLICPFSASLYAQSENAGQLDEFTGYAGEDPTFVLPKQPIEGALGFSKTILETPRSVTVISSEMIANLSISEVSDLSRIAPSTNTTTRWGVQGNIDIRNMVADTYFRGMKRIEPQGNSRTVLGANDQIEIVRGPPPAFFGAGKIGGYTNMTPKSGRSRQGQYLEEDTGFFQIIFGEYAKKEMSFGYGGPLDISPERRGGYYLYGLVEDSDSYYYNIPIRQRVLQAAITQELTENWRIETGINYQETNTAGGFRSRLTQDYVDNGTYWGGRPLVNLDTDGSGRISQQEMVQGSPVGGPLGPLSTTNRDLAVRFYGSTPANGSRFTNALLQPVPAASSANVNSALEALYQANPTFVGIMESDPEQYGDNLRLLNVLQRGFVFDPDTMNLTQADDRAVALEKELLAKLSLFYIDFVNDSNQDLKFKNQILIDVQDQFKDSELPFAQKQDIYVIEDKFTVEWAPDASWFPEWLGVNTISSVNIRYTNAKRNANTGDYDDRPDLSLPANMRTPYDTFVTPLENLDYFNGGAPWRTRTKTDYTEMGIGSMFDVSVGESLSFILGARHDYIDAKTINFAGRYLLGTDGLFATTDLVNTGTDSGFSYTISASYQLPQNLIPYITVGQQTALSDGSDLTIAGNIVAAGPYDSAKITEAGIKGSHFNETFYWAIAAYEQKRSSITADPSGNPLLGGLGNISSEGIELEARWAPNSKFWLSAFSVFSKSLIVDQGTWTRIFGAPLGFSDVLDPTTGEVIYPAEAFTWGGQSSIFVPSGVNNELNGYPNTSHGLSMEYTFETRLSVGTSWNYISEIQSGRNLTIILPEAYTGNANISYKTENGWRFKYDMLNLTDERFFRGRNGSGAADALISAMQGRRSQFTISKSF